MLRLSWRLLLIYREWSWTIVKYVIRHQASVTSIWNWGVGGIDKINVGGGCKHAWSTHLGYSETQKKKTQKKWHGWVRGGGGDIVFQLGVVYHLGGCTNINASGMNLNLLIVNQTFVSMLAWLTEDDENLVLCIVYCHRPACLT